MFKQGKDYKIIGRVILTLRHNKVVSKDNLSSYLKKKHEERHIVNCLNKAERAAIVDQCIDIEKRFDALCTENTIPYKIELVQQYKNLTVMLGFRDRELYPNEKRRTLY